MQRDPGKIPTNGDYFGLMLCLSVCLSISPPVCLSVWLCVCVCVCVSLSLSLSPCGLAYQPDCHSQMSLYRHTTVNF